MAYAAAAPHAIADADPQIRHLAMGDLTDCLKRGWDDFKATPTQLVFLCIVYPIVGLIAARAAFGGSTLPLLFPLVSGFALVGPIAALGIYELSRRRERGDDVSWVQAFDVLRSRSIGSIAVVAFMLLAIFVVWMIAASSIYSAIFGDAAPVSTAAFTHRPVRHEPGSEPHRHRQFGGPGLRRRRADADGCVHAAAARPRRRSAGRHAHVDPRGAGHPAVMAAWGVIVAVLLLAGAAVLMVGLAIVLPVLGHATWHLYRKVVV